MAEHLNTPDLTLLRLERRVERLETVLWTGAVTIGLVTLVAGLFLPFLSETDGDESVTVLSTVFSFKDDAGNGGPFSGEAGLLSVALGVLVLFTLITAVVLLVVRARRASARTLRVCRALAVVELVGCAATWLVVFVLAGHFEKVSAFSPGTLSLTVGAALAVILTGPGRDWISAPR